MKLYRSIHLFLFSLAEEQILDLIFGQERPTQNAHDFKDTTIESEVMFDNCNQTVCDDCNIDTSDTKIRFRERLGKDWRRYYPGKCG